MIDGPRRVRSSLVGVSRTVSFRHFMAGRDQTFRLEPIFHFATGAGSIVEVEPVGQGGHLITVARVDHRFIVGRL